jgi:hypothetical protein
MPCAGQVIRSNYKKVFNGTGFSFCKQLAHGVLRGERLLTLSLVLSLTAFDVNHYSSMFRVPTTLHLQLSPPFPWMNMSIIEYWICCHNSVLSCALRRWWNWSFALTAWLVTSFGLLAFLVGPFRSCTFLYVRTCHQRRNILFSYKKYSSASIHKTVIKHWNCLNI